MVLRSRRRLLLPNSPTTYAHIAQSPKRTPLAIEPYKEPAPLAPPKKYASFSARDSRAIEQAFQRMAEGEDEAAQGKLAGDDIGNAGLQQTGSSKNTNIKDSTDSAKEGAVKVPVNEDYLFDVDIERRELAPTYWLGSVYDVRRGSWFYQEGSALRPCDENLASQIEEGYLKVKPWRAPSSSQTGPAPDSSSSDERVTNDAPSDVAERLEPPKNERSIPAKFELQTHRLFGTYMSSVVTYQDATTAWLLTDDFLSRMSSTVYQRFAGGGHLGGTKIVRGFSEASKEKKDPKKESEAANKSDTAKVAADELRTQSRRLKSVPDAPVLEPAKDAELETDAEPEPRLKTLERKMSTFVSSPTQDPAQEEAMARKRDEEEIREDYVNEDGQDQAREIEHLILVVSTWPSFCCILLTIQTHGIGQRLGLRMKSLNFIHDVNVLRKTLKSVYEASPDLQALNNEVDKLPKNCRVQVLPVVWRHLLDFPKQRFKQNSEQDLTDEDYDDEYPSLENITVEGVPAVRQLMSDLALDILLYQSAYREHIASIVQQECNRVYELFIERNPNFHGKVSMIGHSLGSAILFDILCRQKDANVAPQSFHKPRRSVSQGPKENKHELDFGLKFDIEDFYCLGSPLGLYQMLKGRKISGRSALSALPKTSPLNPDALEDPFLGPASIQAKSREPELVHIGISSPKCAQLFNIFHPADPIAYRVEPLISNAMSPLKPQPLPYTKKGIFGAQGQGFSNIGAMVSQSVGGMWTNLTSGVASSLLNRSLGLTGDGQVSSQTSSAPLLQARRENSLSAGGGTNIAAGGVLSEEKRATEEHPPTLLDENKVTLYAEFEKKQKALRSDDSRDLGESPEWMEAERRSRRLRVEEAKIRALNSNGRVDFSIQE